MNINEKEILERNLMRAFGIINTFLELKEINISEEEHDKISEALQKIENIWIDYRKPEYMDE